MGIGYTLLIVLHILICLLLILLVTVQNDKGGGLAGAFGGMGGGAFTGSSAVTFVTKLTQGVAIASFVVLIALTWVGSRSHSVAGSELTGAGNVLPEAAPAANNTFGPTQTNAPVPGAAPAAEPAPAAQQ